MKLRDKDEVDQFLEEQQELFDKLAEIEIEERN